MFDSIEYIDSGSPKRVSFVISFAAHASVITLAILTPLLFLRPALPPLAPVPSTPVMLAELPVPTPSGGGPRSSRQHPDTVRLPPNVVPPSISREIPDPVPQQIPDIGQLAVNSNAGPGPLGGTSGTGSAVGSLEGALLPAGVVPPVARKAPESGPVDRRSPLRVSAGVIASRLVHRIDPVYPLIAVRARVQGIVVLQVLIDERGAVEEVSVITGHQLLVASAIDAVKQWRYSPTLLNGQPVPVKATVSVHFVLR